jgi:Protein of unknown function (DUF1084)
VQRVHNTVSTDYCLLHHYGVPEDADWLAPQMPVQVQLADPPVVQAVLTDLPGLLFFSTYTLLVLFWAEIYHQARSLPTSKLRPIFVTANAIVYLIQVLD